MKNGCCTNLLEMVVVVQFALSSVHPTQSVAVGRDSDRRCCHPPGEQICDKQKNWVFSVCSVPFVVKVPLLFRSYGKNLRVN